MHLTQYYDGPHSASMALYGFGFNAHCMITRSDEETRPRAIIVYPRRIMEGEIVKVLWASWCDVFVVSKDGLMPESLTYSGIGITSNQLSEISKVYTTEGMTLFGAEMRDGVLGILRTSEPASITFFRNEEDNGYGAKAVDMDIFKNRKHGNLRFKHITVASDGTVHVAANVVETPSSGTEVPVYGCIARFRRLTEFQSWMDNYYSGNKPHNMLRIPIIEGWKHVVSNTISSTALTEDGEIYTWATDRRYPECLGRDPEEQPPEIPAKIPYFSETKIVKVAAGGYMTAALSEDGELFLWGRSPPGAGGELTIFKSDPMQSEERRVRYMTPLGGLKFTLALQPKQSQQSKSTAAEETEYAKRKRGDPATSTTRTALSLPEPRFTGEAFPDNMDTEQEQPMDTDTPDALPPHSPCASDAAYADPYIKLVELSLGGVHSAKVTDVAIGNGHILVAVEAQNEQGKTLRGVFAAGQGTHGQLGRGDGHVFGEEFSEIHTFSGKKVRQLVAAGWTSWVVVEGK